MRDPIAASNARESEFFKTHPIEDAWPEWEDLTDREQREVDYDRWVEENQGPDPDDERDARIFNEMVSDAESQLT